MKHSLLTMWFPNPSSPDYVFQEQEWREERKRSRQQIEETGNRVPFDFEERYSNVSGVITYDHATGSVRQINQYIIFYEDGIVDSEHAEIGEFVLDAIASGYTMAAPPLVLPNTKPAEHYKNGVTVYFFLEVPPHKFSEQARNYLQQGQSQ